MRVTTYTLAYTTHGRVVRATIGLFPLDRTLSKKLLFGYVGLTDGRASPVAEAHERGGDDKEVSSEFHVTVI